jgi:hypothetical protein
VLPLKPVIVEAPFQQWGLEFIGEFKDNSSNGYRWVLTATDYFTRWVEAIPMKKETEEVVMSFLEDRIITRFGTPAKITTDNAKAFSSLSLAEFSSSTGSSCLILPTTIPREMDWQNQVIRIS